MTHFLIVGQLDSISYFSDCKTGCNKPLCTGLCALKGAFWYDKQSGVELYTIMVYYTFTPSASCFCFSSHTILLSTFISAIYQAKFTLFVLCWLLMRFFFHVFLDFWINRKKKISTIFSYSQFSFCSYFLFYHPSP